MCDETNIADISKPFRSNSICKMISLIKEKQLQFAVTSDKTSRSQSLQLEETITIF